MKLDRITITGADGSDRNSNPFMSMFDLSLRYPYVEWGILVTKENSQGNKPRFVNSPWFSEMMESVGPLNFSMHVCGSYVRDMCRGEPSFLDFTHEHNFQAVERIQLNFSCYLHLVDRDRMLRAMKIPELEKKQFILQFSKPDFELVKFLRDAGVDAVPFFDRSGGRGETPGEWPKSPDFYSGYAGGLSPDNVEDELKRIAKAVGQSSVWIDVETGVRNKRNIFSFDLAEQFLRKCKSWMDPDSIKPKCFCVCGWSGKDILALSEKDIESILTSIFGTREHNEKPLGLCPNCKAIFLSFDRPYVIHDEEEDEECEDDDWHEEDPDGDGW